jgi:LacI family transcriptional regulator
MRKINVKSATIADVAREAGVAPMTVSRALNGHPSVKASTMEKVRGAVERLSYSPNPAARILMGQPSNSIALVVPELKNPFFAIVAEGVQTAAQARGTLVWVVSSGNDVAVERSEIEKLLSYRVDGILLISSDPGNHYLKKLASSGTPIVAIDLPIESISTDAVLVENRQGSQDAVQHLIDHGYKNILCIGAWSNLFTIRERIAGYEFAMQKAGLKSHIIADACDIPSARKAIERMFCQKRSRGAIFSLNQLTTEITLNLLDELGLEVPEQVAMIGFDDFAFSSHLKPSLTVVRQPADELGRCAANILFERLASREKVLQRRTLLPTELIVRESCGCHKPQAHRDA